MFVDLTESELKELLQLVKSRPITISRNFYQEESDEQLVKKLKTALEEIHD